MCNFSQVRDRLPIKKVCLVLAITNAVANALLFVASVYVECRVFSPKPRESGVYKLGGIVWGRRKRDVNDAIDDYLSHEGIVPTLWLIMLITAVCSALTVIFSVLVCIGILKRRPGFVNAYVVYGVVISFPIAVFSFLHLCIGDNPGLSIGGLFGCALHAVYIALLYQTRLKLQEEEKLGHHIRLQEVSDFDTRSSAPFYDDKC